MVDLNNDVFLLTEKEFLILAAASDIHSIYGFDLKPDETNRQDAILALHSLQKKGCLVGEDKFVLSRSMKKIFNSIKQADTVIEIHKDSGRTCMIYIGNLTVKIVKSLRRTDTLEVSALRTAELWNHLKEEGWISGNDDIS